MTHLHHIFQEILHDLSRPKNPELETYKVLLRTHDKHFDYSDDHNVYTKGKKEFDYLLKLQRLVDPDRILWNETFKEKK